MRRALITGVTGFIGSALARYLLEAGETEVHGIASPGEIAPTSGLATFTSRRLPHPDFRHAVERWQPNVVYHCAGNSLPTRSLIEPSEDFVSSVPVIQDILESLRCVSPKTHLVVLSSAAVYGQPKTFPISESAEILPMSPYGYHKRLGELLCREYSEIYGIRTTCARVFSAFGSGLKKQIVWEAAVKLRNETDPVFHGTGAETRDFIHIDDLVVALDLIDRCSDGSIHSIYNIASGVETRIDAVVSAVALAIGQKTKNWSFSGEVQPGTPQRWWADIRRLSLKTGIAVPIRSFEESVYLTIGKDFLL